jgi:mono/diheme cytochrome c family protein
VSGCGAVGRVTSGDSSRGKQLFSQKCSSCHTLADAKSSGAVGPNLDDAFSSDKQQGFDEQDVADIVRGQIAYPETPMPANLYRGKDADDVSTYIAKCAGNANCGVTAAGQPQPSGGSAGDQSGGSTSSGAPQGAPKPDGKQVFTSAGCGGCHTLKAAGSSGNVGPNLDDLKPEAARVAHQVEVGGGPMPSFKATLSPKQIQDVAAFVATSTHAS